MKFAIALVVGLSTMSFAHAEGCDYVEAAKNFEVGQHGPLLSTYLNYDPVPGTGSGDQAERDDDRFGVCRILQDGTVITSFGCAGKDKIVRERVIRRSTLKALFNLLQDEKNLTGQAVEAYRENLYENYPEDGSPNIYASTRDAKNVVQDESTQKRVLAQSSLARMIRQLCPLDNERAHSRLVKKLR